MSDLQKMIEDAMRLVSERTSYQPDIHILPPWLKPHDDPEPRVLLCHPESTAVVRAIVAGYGLAEHYDVREDDLGIVESGKLILMRPAAWRMQP